MSAFHAFCSSCSSVEQWYSSSGFTDKFCKLCGSEMIAYCKKCGQPFETNNSKFCPKCGTKIKED